MKLSDMIDNLIQNKEEVQRLSCHADRFRAAQRNLSEVEDQLVVALNHVGPVVWAGCVWYTQSNPRLGRIWSAAVRRADKIDWPPIMDQPPPEKAAGFISQQHT